MKIKQFCNQYQLSEQQHQIVSKAVAMIREGKRPYEELEGFSALPRETREGIGELI